MYSQNLAPCIIYKAATHAYFFKWGKNPIKKFINYVNEMANINENVYQNGLQGISVLDKMWKRIKIGMKRKW